MQLQFEILRLSASVAGISTIATIGRLNQPLEDKFKERKTYIKLLKKNQKKQQKKDVPN